MSALKSVPETPGVLLEMTNIANVGWVDRPRNDPANRFVVAGPGGLQLGVLRLVVDDIVDIRCSEVDLEDPTPIEVVGLRSRRLQLLNTGQF
jgi:hypothetical protein